MATGTPATVLLIRNGVAFSLHAYSPGRHAESFGAEAAAALGVSPDRIFKTLIAAVDGQLV
ncbi:MAG: Cys-tRNA(Pro) deacylase, partial [Jatrophihabitantaceae bacterium]